MSEFRVPDGWESIELEKILEYEQPTKYLVSSENYNNSYKTPVLTAGKTFILGYTDETEGIFNKELPVLIFDDFTTASKYVNFPFKAKSSAMKILKIRDNTIDIKIVFELMQRLNFKPEEHKRHWISTYSKLKINLPKSKKEQQKIAEILSEVDGAITLTKELIEKNKRLKTALMQELLSYGIDENGQIRSPKTHKFKPSPLGDIPVEWEVEKIGDIFDLYAGGTPKRNNKMFYNGDIPWIKSGEVNQDKIYNTEEFISNKGLQSSSAKLIPKHSILIAMYGATAGQVSILEIEKATANQAVLAIIISDNYSYIYLFNILKFMMNQILYSLQGSGQLNLSKNTIANLLIPFPKSKIEQQKIANILSSQDEKIEKLKNKLTKLNHLKTSLMQDLLSGKVRVNKLLEAKGD